MEMLEQVKISDDIFDVIDLSENQHSDMLAWCLNPNEGHAQGDALIKDFLIAAHAESFSCTWDNKQFFAYWTPSRVRTSSFGAAFLTREFSIKLDDEGKKGRLDLFLIDPTNKLLIAIENKAGAKLSESQLSTYCERVNREFGSRPIFKDYRFAFIVLDRDLDSYSEEHVASLGTRWAFLNYQWLEAAATRAKHHLARNNQAAQLLMAYCQKQTNWEKPSAKRLSELAAEIAMDHEPILNMLKDIKLEKIVSWTPSLLTGEVGDLRLFYQQNTQLCKILLEAGGMGAIAGGLKRLMPTLGSESIEKTRTWLAFVTNSMHSLLDADVEEANWPIYITIRRESSDDAINSKFAVRFVWCREDFHPEFEAEKLRSFLAKSYPELDRFSAFPHRRVVVKRQVEASSAIKLAYEIAQKIDKAIKDFEEQVTWVSPVKV